jgi:hypothetical protein
MESRVSRKGLFRSHTEDSYDVYRKKFADFLSEEFNPNSEEFAHLVCVIHIMSFARIMPVLVIDRYLL